MLITIEGVDLTGKTTLARKLADLTDGAIIHAGPPKLHPLEEYETPITWYKPARDSLILDRWHVGEYVWPQIFDRPTAFDTAVSRHVELFMQSRGAVVVYAERDPVQLAEDLDASDEPLRSTHLDRALHRFDLALGYGAHRGDVFSWDFTNPRSTPETIVAAAQRGADAVAPVHAVTADWIGHPKPRVLLVGDEMGPKRNNVEEPAGIPFGPFGATSGHYLMNALPEGLWRDTAIVNSRVGRSGEFTRLKDLWRVLSYPNVVALGGKASVALREVGIEHETVPHPQFWRRFRYHHLDEYTSMILEAATC